MKISILTPSLNAACYIERAIQSVLAQKDPDVEHIIVDGASTDGTMTILRRYPHLKWVSEPDRDQTDAMNKAFAMSQGDVVTYLNADDWFEPGIFAHVRDCFVSEPNTDMVIGNFYCRYAGKPTVQLVVPVKDYRSTLLFFRCEWALNPVCYFYRRTIQEAVGEFPAEVGFGRDYWFIIRAMAKARIHRSDMVFGSYYFHPDSETVRKSGVNDVQKAGRQFRKWIRQHLKMDNPRLLTWWNAHWFFHHWVHEFPERVKAPFRCLAYKVMFANLVDYDEYRALGFRRAYRKRFLRHK